MAHTTSFLEEDFTVDSPNVTYTDDEIVSKFTYETTTVVGTTVTPKVETMMLRTARKVPKTGLMLVGLGGNNGCTTVAGILANQQGLTWRTKDGECKANYFGSLTQASTVRLGADPAGAAVYVPFNKMLPMVHPNDLVVGGWDISKMNLGDAMKRSRVLDVQLQDQLYDQMSKITPLPSVYFPEFIAANQSARADNVITGSKQQQLDHVRSDIQQFKKAHGLDKVIVLWTANTERFAAVEEGVNDTSEALLAAIARGEDEISPSTLFAVACILEGCTYINGSPQNTFVPGVMQLAEEKKSFIAGDDFKSGQTKMKSVLVDFLVSAGIKPVSIASYNHLGNNDGKNLSSAAQFRSKEISKSNVVDDMVASNRLLYREDEHPDHLVVIKYMPYVGDSKRALDEYTSEIFLGGKNTISMHNTCEDSLLATPLIYDLTILAEVCERIQIKRGDGEWESMHSVLSILSYMLKAPLVPPGTPIVNALFAQRQCIVNLFRACVGLSPESHLTLEHKLPSALAEAAAAAAADGAPARKRARNA